MDGQPRVVFFATQRKKKVCLEMLTMQTQVVELSSDDEGDDQLHDDDEELTKWFLRYKEPNAESIQTTGLLTFCEDLGVDPEDLAILVLMWKMQAKSSMQITRVEFFHGMHALNVSSIAKLKQHLPTLKKELSKPKSFKAVYEYTYGWALEPGMKGLPKEVALAYWGLLLPLSKFDLMNDFMAFMQARPGGVSKDLWFQVLLFISQVSGDFSKYDENGAWSFVLDEFVAEMKKKPKKS